MRTASTTATPVTAATDELEATLLAVRALRPDAELTGADGEATWTARLTFSRYGSFGLSWDRDPGIGPVNYPTSVLPGTITGGHPDALALLLRYSRARLALHTAHHGAFAAPGTQLPPLVHTERALVEHLVDVLNIVEATGPRWHIRITSEHGTDRETTEQPDTAPLWQGRAWTRGGARLAARQQIARIVGPTQERHIVGFSDHVSARTTEGTHLSAHLSERPPT